LRHFKYFTTRSLHLPSRSRGNAPLSGGTGEGREDKLDPIGIFYQTLVMEEKELQESYSQGFQDGIQTLKENSYKKGLEIGKKILSEISLTEIEIKRDLNFREIVKLSNKSTVFQESPAATKSLSW
jgi:hypothetical protein